MVGRKPPDKRVMLRWKCCLALEREGAQAAGSATSCAGIGGLRSRSLEAMHSGIRLVAVRLSVVRLGNMEFVVTCLGIVRLSFAQLAIMLFAVVRLPFTHFAVVRPAVVRLAVVCLAVVRLSIMQPAITRRAVAPSGVVPNAA